MRKGEKGILIAIAGIVLVLMAVNGLRQSNTTQHDRELPFYTVASKELQQTGGELYHRLQCKRCHSLWSVRDIMQAVPAPALDGIGSLRDEKWLFDYLSAVNPQSILPSRLKQEYRMPSYADLPENDRRTLARFLGALKVKDWYLDETRAAECRKLTGETC